MEEEANQNSVQEEIVPQDSTQNHDDSAQQTEVQQPIKEDRARENFKRLEMQKREIEKELRIQREINERLLSMTKNVESQKPVVDELDEVGEEEYIPKGKVQRLVAKQAKAIVQEEMQAFHLKQEQSQFVNRLKSKYGDFSDVVNQETLSLLEEHEPELAQSIAESKDPYKMGVQSYKYIKALGLHTKTVEAGRKREVEKKLDKNAKTVPSPALYDKRPMAQAFKLTEAMKSDLYEEMMGYSRMASSVPELNAGV